MNVVSGCWCWQFIHTGHSVDDWPTQVACYFECRQKPTDSDSSWSKYLVTQSFWCGYLWLLGPFCGAIEVPSVTRCRCCRRRRRGHRCAGGVRQWRRATVATRGEWQCKTGGVRRLAVAIGPTFFQMLLVFICNWLTVVVLHCYFWNLSFELCTLLLKDCVSAHDPSLVEWAPIDSASSAKTSSCWWWCDKLVGPNGN